MKIFDFHAAVKRKLLCAVHDYLAPENAGLEDAQIRNPFEWNHAGKVYRGKIYDDALTKDNLMDLEKELSELAGLEGEIWHLFFPSIQEGLTDALERFKPQCVFYSYSACPSYPEPFYRFTLWDKPLCLAGKNSEEQGSARLRLTREELSFLADLCLDLPSV